MLPTQISELKPLRSGHPDSANVLEQEKNQRTDRKMGLQAKERKAGGTVAPFNLLTPLRWLAPSLAAFEPWVRRKSVKPGLER